MTQDVGQAFGHQHANLIHGTAELQVAQIKARRESLAAPLMVSQLVLQAENTSIKIEHLSLSHRKSWYKNATKLKRGAWQEGWRVTRICYKVVQTREG